MLKLALPAISLALLIGAVEWDRYRGTERALSFEELDAHLRSEFDLRELQLAHLPDGRFEGNGAGPNGRSYRFEITQTNESRTIHCEWKRENGRDSGEVYKSTVFSNNNHVYLLLGFGYLVWVGKMIRAHARKYPGAGVPRVGAHRRPEVS